LGLQKAGNATDVRPTSEAVYCVSRAAGNEADAAFLVKEKLSSRNSSVHGFSKAELKTLALSLIQTWAKALKIRLMSVFQ
jgi:hypothetical protein